MLFFFKHFGGLVKKYLSILTKCPLFSGIRDEDILAILRCLDAQVIQTARNLPVLREGVPARYVGIVLSGRVQIVRHAFSGSRSIISTCDPAQVFGAAYACADVEALPVSVLAVLDSEILMIDYRRMMNTCTNACAFNSRIMSNLLNIVSKKNIFFSEKLDIVSQRTTRDKLLSFLYAQARQSGSLCFSIPYNRQQLADYLGVSRCAMTTELTRLEKDGLIRYHRNEFELPSLPDDHD